MVFKYILSVSGEVFYPVNIIDEIIGNFLVASYFNPTDIKVSNKSDVYGYGSISFFHPKKFSTQNEIIKYEKDFIEFIQLNYLLFTNNGANDFEMFMEIYFDGGQCNFAILNKDLFPKIANIGISLPVSIYVLKPEEISMWESEINLMWDPFSSISEN